MSRELHLPEVPDLVTADEMLATAAAIVEWQLPSGMIPWFPGGHADVWNHVEAAMALDLCGFHDEALRAYDWLVGMQRADVGVDVVAVGATGHGDDLGAEHLQHARRNLRAAAVGYRILPVVMTRQTAPFVSLTALVMGWA